MHRLAVNDRLDPLHIGPPHPIGAPMRVADLDAEGNALIAEITLCQLPHLPGRNMQNSVNYNNRQAGKKIHGYEILTPEDAFAKYPGATFVLTPRWYENELLQQLTGIGVDISNILIISMLETGLDII